ncbi:ankyrin repeat domain-containing protein [Crenobacter sp. SG2303]|uniref:Ankyrin repeat domain-containing protein n=1 Tax=Crenobacter oryzisoli TaxID=3056844 RepID=A0ABT7XQB8_9NEIS|nr:ankyrin repeat domain-containing protein [Crenobacter sp. SG2303]MDN0075987.1 ankyrin repeat domain-containing protein [Crenobacter sp. SG2303]
MKIKFLLSIGALLLAQQALAACDKDGWRQLLRHADAPAVVTYVKNQHCDLNQSLDDVSKTPLVYAIDGRNRAAVQALLQSGANPNADGYDGNTPLFYAVAAKDLGIVEDLIARGADVNASTRTSEITVLMAAVLDSTPAIVAYLVAHGASLDDTDKYGHKAINYVDKLPTKRQAAIRAALKKR